jgi:hypothetical protein
MPAYKNQFVRPDHHEHEILSSTGSKIGTIRLKPNRVLWKPVGAGKFFGVSLDKFKEWIIADETGARKSKS